MNKGEFLKALEEKTGLSKNDAKKAYDSFVEIVTETLKKGEKIQLLNFGTFEVKDVPAKVGINPQTKEKVDIPACKKPVMKMSSALKKELN